MANLTKAQILTAFEAELDKYITHTDPCTDAEIFIAQNVAVEVAYSINPDTKPTPKIKFKNQS